MTDSQIDQWAKRQLADYDAHCPGTMFGDGIELTVKQAYELQAAVTTLRCNRGERVLGYKVGCTSATIRAQLGIDHCIFGTLYSSEKHRSGSILSRSDYANLAIEGELAVQLSREPIESDLIADQIPACVSRVAPVIELHHHVIRGDQSSAAELIANNAIHAGFVLGDGVSPTDVLGESLLRIFADDRLIEQCEGAQLVHTINSSLAALTPFLRHRGDRLCEGQTVLTGSIARLIPIKTACRIRVEAPPFGSVGATID